MIAKPGIPLKQNKYNIHYANKLVNVNSARSSLHTYFFWKLINLQDKNKQKDQGLFKTKLGVIWIDNSV